MDMDKKRRLEKILLLAVKIAVGSAAAVYVAEALHLENAVSAGTVTLLSLLGTKRETVRVSIARIGAFLFTVLLAYLAVQPAGGRPGLFPHPYYFQRHWLLRLPPESEALHRAGADGGVNPASPGGQWGGEGAAGGLLPL